MDTEKKKNPIIICMCGVIIILLVVVVVLLFRKPTEEKKEGTDETANDFVTTMITKEEDAVIHATDPGYYTIEMQLVGKSSDGQVFDGEISNALENIHPVYVTITLDETGEEVFKSGILPVGTRIDSFTISKKLDTGKHSCVLVFHQVDENDTSYVISTVSVAYTLSVN